MSQKSHSVSNFASLVRLRARQRGERTAYVFLADGETESGRLSFAGLDREAHAIASHIQREAPLGARALLLYPPGLDYIRAFFACLCAGVIAVPVCPPTRRHLQRLSAIVRDASPALVLTTAELRARLGGTSLEDADWRHIPWIATDVETGKEPGAWIPPSIGPEHLAFLQYTSGSTGDPKGVMVSHGNLLANERLIQKRFGHTQDSMVVGWLPLYHDMGLIGNVLQPLYCGATAILMPSMAFLERPIRWLRTISRYRAHTSGGPDFAYSLCTRKVTAQEKHGLDLSSWRVAFDGAEPVRATTLERFAKAFAPCGFRPEAFFPCYGLAEATLFVTGPGDAERVRVKRFERTALTERREAAPPSDETSMPLDLVSCGQASDGNRLAIVDPVTHVLCPDGHVGEIWVAGPSVARGYWDRPVASEPIFRARLADGSSDAFLRTGDLGLLTQDHLYITGRLKDLIIIRGRNYHPEDLERALDEYASELRPGACAAFSIPREHEETLVVVAEADRAYPKRHGSDAIFASMRRALAEACDAPLATLVLVQRGSVPKTSSGKVRRQACKQDYLARRLQIVAQLTVEVEDNDTSRPLGTDTNTQLLPDSLDLLSSPQRAELLTRFLIAKTAALTRLPQAQLTPDRSLRAIGVDSLRVVEIKHALDGLLGVDVPIALLVSDKTVAELVYALVSQISATRPGSVTPDHPAAPGQETKDPLSYAQRLIWTVHQLDPDSIAYNLHLAFRLYKRLDPELFRRALDHLLARHAILRTAYTATAAGVTQTVLPLAAVPDHLAWMEAAEWSGSRLQQDFAHHAREPFDLTRGPVMRVTVYRHAEDVHTLLFCAHHIAVDLWSLMVLMTELRTVYEALARGRDPRLPEIESSYQDFVHWQGAYLASPSGAVDWEYWCAQLRGPLPLLALPADHARPSTPHYSGRSQLLHLDAGLTAQLRELAQQHDATLFMLLLAAYKVLLYRYTHQREIIVGAPSSGRSQGRFATVAGNFVNPIALRTYPAPDLPFSGFLQEVRETVLGALAHQDFPFPMLVERLQPERHADHWPLYQTWFVLQQAQSEVEQELAQLSLGEDGTAFAWGEWTIEPLHLRERVENFDLKVMAAEHRDGLLLSFQYRPDLFRPDTMARLAGHFKTLLEGIVNAPEQRLCDLPLLSADERHQVIQGWNATCVDYPMGGYIPGLLVQQVARTPDAPAVLFGDRALSYRELNEAANRLANGLIRRGLGREAIVGVCARRSLELVMGLLGILKAGAAYLPLDPDHPQERLAGILDEARPSLVLVQAGLLDRLPEHGGRSIILDPVCTAFAEESAKEPEAIIHGEQLAYVLYTSGSTGRPKGVGCIHKGLRNRLLWMQSVYGLTTGDAVLQKTPSSFDVSVWELFWPLITGARLVLAGPDDHKDPERLAALIERYGITTLHFVPSMLKAFLEAVDLSRCQSLRRVICSGEALSAELRDRFRERLTAELHNLYGPTEASIDVTAWDCTQEGAGRGVPIGLPIANTQIYLLDGAFNSVPIGVAGELYIGGVGLARGYLNRPDLTTAAFVPNPFGAPGGRLYRTGDLARYRPDGAIEYLGRIDHQVKVRGFRIELEEIEHQLLHHPSVKQAVVVAREDRPGDKRLVAYLIATEPPVDTAASVEALRAYLGTALPDYMVPSAFVYIEALPLNPNGKLDRKALPAPDVSGQLADQYLAPRTETEAQLARIWAEVLRVERVGIHDNFFALGGDSILAIQVASRANQQGFTLTPRQVFQHQTVAALAQVAAHTQESGPAESHGGAVFPLPHRHPRFPLAALDPHVIEQLLVEDSSIEDIYPVAPMQEGMLFHTLMQPGTGVYVMQDRYELHGRIDIEAFREAWQRVADHHPILRTSFLWRTELRPHQIVHRDVKLPFEYFDWRGLEATEQEARLEAMLETERRAGFDLMRAPLIRIRLIRLTGDRYRCVRSFHHILLDEWCTSPLWLDFRTSYLALVQGQPPPALTAPPFRDYIAWLQRQDMEAAERFWRDTLRGFTKPTPLVVDRTPTPALPLGKGEGGDREEVGIVDTVVELSAAVTSALYALTKREQLTPNTLVQAAWAVLLSRYSGCGEVLFGVTVAGRPTTLPGIERTLGLFVNSLPLRVRVRPEQTLREWLRELLAANLDLRQYEYAPLVRIQSWSEVPRGDSLFDHLLVFENAPVDPSLRERADELAVDYLGNRIHTNYPVTVTVVPGSRLSLKITCARDRFEAAIVDRMLGHFKHVLEEMIRQPAARLGELTLLVEHECRQILDTWNRTERPYPPALADFVASFEQQVSRTPGAAAVVCGNTALSYRALNARANRVAHALIGCGVGPEMIVAVLDERGIDLLVAILAILKAGGVYLPLDPSHPEARWLQVIKASRPGLVLAGEDWQTGITGVLAQLGESRPSVAILAELAQAQNAEADPPRRGGPRDLAYIIFTSGSTGAPKGAMVERQGMFNNLMTKVPALGLTATDVIAQTAPQCFDISVWQFLTAFLCGARVEILPDAVTRDPRSLLRALNEKGVTILESVPSMIQAMLDAPGPAMPLPTLRWLLPTGEACPPELCRRWRERYPHVALLNAYGPAECADDVAYHRITADDEAGLWAPLGRPVDNMRLYILDRTLHPVPIGVPGELCVAGIGVGRGYLGRPDLTAAAFIPNPFGPPGTRLYRTGDLACYRPDGTIEFLGRIDQQVKIRGYRIELGEIEAQLALHPAVKAAVVAVHEPVAGDRRLAAYVVLYNLAGSSVSSLPHELQTHLRAVLPDYMVPSAFVFLEALPLTPNGKVDRRNLPVPEWTSDTQDHVAPGTPTEEILAGIWSEVLGVKGVAVHDHFFELGGHSLLATQVMARIANAFAVELPLRSVFEAPTVAQLAAVVDAVVVDTPSLTLPLQGRWKGWGSAGERNGPLPLSYAQRRLWFMAQLDPDDSFYHFPTAVRFTGRLDRAVVAQSINAIIRRHEALRTVFVEHDGEPAQVVLPELTVALPVEDLMPVTVENREAALHRRLSEEIRLPFDLAHGPLMRLRLFVLERGSVDHSPEYVLLLVFHHIVFDGWSFGILAREFGVLYSSFLAKRPSPLPDLALQYADYAQWQRAWLQGEVLERRLNYWTERLRGSPPLLELPTGRPRAAARSLSGAEYSFTIPAELGAGLRGLSRKQGVTLFMTLLAGFEILLYYHTGREDLVVGTDVANRSRAEIEALIGFFINLLALRVNLSGNPTFTELLARVRATTLSAYAHQDAPFDRVVEALRPARRPDSAPIFQVKLVTHNVPLPLLRLPDLKLQAVPIERELTELDLVLHVFEDSDTFGCVFEYRRDLFEATTIVRFAEQYVGILRQAVAAPDTRLQDLREQLDSGEPARRRNRVSNSKRKGIRIS